MLNSIQGSEICPLLVRAVDPTNVDVSLSPSELAYLRLSAGAEALASSVAAVDTERGPTATRLVSCASLTNTGLCAYSDALYLLSWFQAHAQ